MKIGVIGLGNIAQKAYLPTYSECRHLAEFVLATRKKAHCKALSYNGLFACF